MSDRWWWNDEMEPGGGRAQMTVEGSPAGLSAWYTPCLIRHRYLRYIGRYLGTRD
jgi:hypothetical protein